MGLQLLKRRLQELFRSAPQGLTAPVIKFTVGSSEVGKKAPEDQSALRGNVRDHLTDHATDNGTDDDNADDDDKDDDDNLR